MPSPLWIFGMGLTIVALVLLIWKGRRPEREAGGGYLAAMTLSGWVDHLAIGQFRWAVAMISIALLAFLVRLALRYDRWWLLFAAGAQLLALATHVSSLIGPDALTWSIVTTRMVAWVQMMGLAIFGVWEARAAPYAQTDNRRIDAKPRAV